LKESAICLALLGILASGCQFDSVPRRPQTEEAVTRPQSVRPSENPVATASSEALSTPVAPLSVRQLQLLKGARSTLGDIYDDAYYAGGPPPAGRGACTDVVYASYLEAGTDLQVAIEDEIAQRPSGFPSLGDRNINYRRCPNLIVWFRRHATDLSVDGDFQPGDVVFWSLLDDGVADHVGIVSDKPGYIIHNFPPRSREDRSLHKWRIVGHFRMSL
jgi:uncharacterized protein